MARKGSFGRLLRGQAKRKQAGELARKNSNQKGETPRLASAGTTVPAGAPSSFPAA